MKTHSVLPMQIAKFGSIGVSALLCVLGVVFIANPGASVAAMSRLLGLLMTVFGAVRLTGYFSGDPFRLAFQYDLQLGLLLVILGAAVLLHPAAAAGILASAFGFTFLADSLFKAQMAFDAKRFGIGQWPAILLLAAAAAVAGVLLVLRPQLSAQAVTVLLGLLFVAEGALGLCVSLCTVRIARTREADFALWETDADAR